MSERKAQYGNSIQDVYEQYKHMDHLLSDREWWGSSPQGHILCDLWQTVKEQRGCLQEAIALANEILERVCVREEDAPEWEKLEDRLIALEDKAAKSLPLDAKN